MKKQRRLETTTKLTVKTSRKPTRWLFLIWRQRFYFDNKTPVSGTHLDHLFLRPVADQKDSIDVH